MSRPPVSRYAHHWLKITRFDPRKMIVPLFNSSVSNVNRLFFVLASLAENNPF